MLKQVEAPYINLNDLNEPIGLNIYGFTEEEKAALRERLSHFSKETLYMFLFLMLFIISLSPVDVVSAQTIEDDGTNLSCVVETETTDWDTERDENGRIIRISMTYIYLDCDDPEIDDDRPIELTLMYTHPEHGVISREDLPEDQLEKIAQHNLVIINSTQEVDSNYNCHSYTMQMLQKFFDFDFGVDNLYWDDGGSIQMFVNFFTNSVFSGEVDNFNNQTVDLQIGDIVLFYPYEGGSLVHSAIITGFDDSGQVIASNKLGQSVLVNGSIGGIAGYYNSTYVEINRFDFEDNIFE